MSRPLLTATVAAAVVLVAARTAGTQCAFEHPKKAAKYRVTLVQAFVPCGGPCGEDCLPNSATGDDVPACKPPQTFREIGGYLADGWQWSEEAGRGEVKLSPKPACAAVSKGTSLPACDPASPLNPPGTADLAVSLKLKHVVTSNGLAAAGTGTLLVLLRVTLADPTGGDMSLIDLPLSFPFDLVDGNAHLESSVDAFLNTFGAGVPGLPACSSIQVVDTAVLDGTGSRFASAGVWLR